MINYNCANCNVELFPKKNGVVLVHYIDNDKKKGIDAIRFGDLWSCKLCDTQVVIGLGKETIDFVMLTQKKLKSMIGDSTIIEVKR